MNYLLSGVKRRLLVIGAVAAIFSGVATGVQANDIVALKNALYGAGYSIDNVSASMDASTRSALKAFQKDSPDLKASGEFDDATKQALGIIPMEAAQSKTVASQKTSAPESSKKSVSKTAVEKKKDAAKEDEEDDGGWLFF